MLLPFCVTYRIIIILLTSYFVENHTWGNPWALIKTKIVCMLMFSCTLQCWLPGATAHLLHYHIIIVSLGLKNSYIYFLRTIRTCHTLFNLPLITIIASHMHLNTFDVMALTTRCPGGLSIMLYKLSYINIIT